MLTPRTTSFARGIMLVRRLLPWVVMVMIAGCGGKAHQPVIRLVKDGKPFAPDETKGEQMMVTLHPLGGGTETYMAGPLEPEEGMFQVRGDRMKGIPPGEYRVAIQLMQMPVGGSPG